MFSHEYARIILIVVACLGGDAPRAADIRADCALGLGFSSRTISEDLVRLQQIDEIGSEMGRGQPNWTPAHL